MAELHICARHYATGQLVDIICEGDRIVSMEPGSVAFPSAIEEDLWVAPAFFDLQINGCDGRAFSSTHLQPADVRHVVDVCLQHGIAGLCPTLITNSHAALKHGFSVLARACDADAGVSRAVPAFHLEGPYISHDDGPRGAHPAMHVRAPDWEEFQHLQDAAGGRIRLVTLAPEHEGALEFIEKLTREGVVVALGHTAASGPRIRDAIRAGAKLSTHLGNGSHAMLPRHENYLWEQLAADDLLASVIADGHHLPPAVLRCIARVKTPARLILTCDASSLAGLPPGTYQEWDQSLEVRPEGKVVVPGTVYLAGSAVFTDTCVGIAQRDMGVTLAQAVDMACAHPRQLLGLPPRPLEVGAPADLILFEHHPERSPFRLRKVVSAGRIMASAIQ